MRKWQHENMTTCESEIMRFWSDYEYFTNSFKFVLWSLSTGALHKNFTHCTRIQLKNRGAKWSTLSNCFSTDFHRFFLKFYTKLSQLLNKYEILWFCYNISQNLQPWNILTDLPFLAIYLTKSETKGYLI